jgi:competence protein ComEC
MTVESVNTRFRAYQLDTAGSSFSYCSGKEFTLIEGRYCDANEEGIARELRICGLERITTLHITSWDLDHCSPTQLEKILRTLKPTKIEYPGYEPHTDCGKESLAVIKTYKPAVGRPRELVSVTPEYIASLDSAASYGYRHILYHPKSLDPDCANNNSTVKQFRSGSFNVLSLGDVESSQIASYLRRMKTIHSEVDIMIMAHHGADNGFTTSAFIKKVSPTLAVATSNFGNQFDHPKPEIRELLYKNDIRLFTTKTGDVIVRSIGGHTGQYEVINLKAGSTEVSSSYVSTAKKSHFLRHNADSLRDRRATHNRGPRH